MVLLYSYILLLKNTSYHYGFALKSDQRSWSRDGLHQNMTLSDGYAVGKDGQGGKREQQAREYAHDGLVTSQITWDSNYVIEWDAATARDL